MFAIFTATTTVAVSVSIAMGQIPGEPESPKRDKSVTMIGTVVKKSSRGLIFRTNTNAGKPINVMLDYDHGGRAPIKRLRPGNLARIEATKIDGPKSKDVEAFYRASKADVIRLRWDAGLKDKPVVGGTVQNFRVNGLVNNSGDVALKGKLHVRLWQRSSPNDWVKTIPFTIGAKRREKFSTTFTIYNFVYIGATSVPLVETTVTDIEIVAVDR